MPSDDLVVQAVQFADDVITISYAEGREQSKTIGIGRSMYLVVDDDIKAQVDEVLDTLREIIDAGHLSLRNPAPTARSGI